MNLWEHLMLVAVALVALSPTVGGFLFRATLAMPLVWINVITTEQVIAWLNW